MRIRVVHNWVWNHVGASLLMLFLLYPGEYFAQLVRPYHRSFSIAEGLPTNMITDLAEDQDGGIWLTTGAGVSRFDGVEFHNYKPRLGDPRTVPNEFMSTIAAGRDGMLYAGGNSHQLCIIDPRTDTVRSLPIPGVDPNNIMAAVVHRVMCDSRGRVWISHGFRKLTMYLPSSGEFLTQDIRPDRGPSMRCETINRIVEDRDGSLWLGTMFGLVHFLPSDDPKENAIGVATLHSHPDRTVLYPGYDGVDHITDIIERDDHLLVATLEQGLFAFDRGTGTFQWRWRGGNTGRYGDDPNVIDMASASDDRVWLLGERGGVRILSEGTGVVRSYDRDLHPNRVDRSSPLFPRATCALRDRNGHHWFGSASDGLMLIPSRSGHFQQVFLDPERADRGEAMKLFRSVRDTATGITYALCTTGQGLYAVHPDGMTITRHAPYDSEELVCGDMRFRKDGKAYVSTERGLYLFDPANGSFVRPKVDASGLTILSKKIFRMSLDREEGLWLAISGVEPHRYDPSNGSVTSLFDLAPDSREQVTGRVSFAEVDPEDRVWFAGYDNLPFILLPDGRCVKVPVRDQGEADPRLFYLNGITFPSDGSAWISVFREGAMEYRFVDGLPVRNSWLSTAEGLSTDQVFRIASDHKGRIWIGTLNGLNRYDPSDGSVHFYSLVDGLAMMEQTYGLDISADGRYVIAGATHGYAILDLFETDGPEAPPRVQLRSITSFGTPVLTDPHGLRDEPFQLEHSQHQLTILVRSDERADAPSVRYAYRMRASDTTWVDVGREERITLAHLDPGEHLFEVRARKGDGPWGPVSAVPFIITPPFWATWWFRLLMVLLLAGIATVVFQWRLSMRTRSIELRHAREQALSEERMRIADDLHDELGSGLSVIKVKSQLALERPATNPAMEVLQQVASSSSELIDGMRQIIWTIRSGRSGLLDLIAYMRSYAVGYLSDHHLTCHFEVDETLHDRDLSVEQRRALLLILKEALHNVVKHAQASRVTVSISGSDRLILRIADDGVGIPERTGTDPAHGVGLKSMENRARSIGGRLSIERHEGTRITVEVPLPQDGTGPNVPFGKMDRKDTFVQ